MANVTNQTSLGVRCVGGGCTDIYKQVPGTTLSKIIRLKALHLKWCMFLTDRRLPVEPTHTHTQLHAQRLFQVQQEITHVEFNLAPFLMLRAQHQSS